MMKNLFMLSLILVFNTIYSFSQDKGYIAVSLGPSIPTSDFASKNIDNEAAGFAQPGGMIDISFGYKLSKNYGIAAMLRGQINNLDKDAISTEITKGLPWVNDNVRTGSWKIGGLMVGGYGTFPITNKVSFEPKFLFGLLLAKSPELNIDLTGPDGSGWVKQNSVTSSTFGALVGAGFKYNAGKKMCLFANIDYLGAKPEFRDVETTTNFDYREKGTYSQTFGTVNLGIGVGYKL
jgi:hypothetical protein